MDVQRPTGPDRVRQFVLSLPDGRGCLYPVDSSQGLGCLRLGSVHLPESPILRYGKVLTLGGFAEREVRRDRRGRSLVQRVMFGKDGGRLHRGNKSSARDLRAWPAVNIRRRAQSIHDTLIYCSPAGDSLFDRVQHRKQRLAEGAPQVAGDLQASIGSLRRNSKVPCRGEAVRRLRWPGPRTVLWLGGRVDVEGKRDGQSARRSIPIPGSDAWSQLFIR